VVPLFFIGALLQEPLSLPERLVLHRGTGFAPGTGLAPGAGFAPAVVLHPVPALAPPWRLVF